MSTPAPPTRAAWRIPDLLGTGDLFNVAAGGGNATEYYNQQREVLGSYSLAQQTIEQNDLIAKLVSDADRKDLSQADQLDLFVAKGPSPASEEVLATLRELDPDRLTGIEALQLIARLKTKL